MSRHDNALRSVALAALCMAEAACAPTVFEELAPTGWSLDLGRGRGIAVAASAEGEILLTGELDQHASNILAAKLDPSGHEVWRRDFEAMGATAGRGRGLAVTGDADGNTYVTGFFSGIIDFGGGPRWTAGINNHQLFVVKLDRDGNHLWSRSFGDEGAPDALVTAGSGVAVDGAGNVLLTGYYAGAVDFGGGTLPRAELSRGFVARLDAAGQHVWSMPCGDRGNAAIAADAEGNALLAGDFEDELACGGEAIAGAGLRDAFVVKLDPSGQARWARRLGGSGWQGARSLAVDAAGAVIVAGSFSGAMDAGGAQLVSESARDAFVVKLTASGDPVFARRFGDSECVEPDGCLSVESIAAGPRGETFLTGGLTGALDLGGGTLRSAGADVLVAVLDPLGHPRLSGRFGDGRAQRGTAIAALEGGDLVLAGAFDGALDLVGTVLRSPGRFDLFVARLEP